MKTTKMICPNCNTNEAQRHPTLGILPCSTCQSQAPRARRPAEFLNLSKVDRISSDRDHHERDMLQPYIGAGEPNPDWVRANPSLAKQTFSSQELSKL